MEPGHVTNFRIAKATSRRAIVYGFGGVWFLLIAGLWVFVAGDLRPRDLMLLTMLAYVASWGGYFAVSVRNRRQKAMRFVVVSASFTLALGIVEAASSYWKVDYQRIVERPLRPWEKTMNLLDRQLIHVRRPNVRYRGMIKRGNLSPLADGQATKIVRPYDVQFDRNGFRNDNDRFQADCIVIGDSFVEGFHVLTDELHTKRVEEILGLQVVNLGRSGYGPQQELIVLERYGVSLQPKLCLWAFFEGNDLEDVREYKMLVDSWPATVANYSSRKNKSFTKNFFWWLSQRIGSRGAQPRTRRAALLPTGEGFTRLWFGFVGKELSSSDVAALRVTTESIQRAHTLCQENGIELAVVFVPTKFRVYAGICEFEDTSLINQWTVNDLPQRLAEEVSAISDEIGFVDLTPDLRKEALQGAVLYFPTDTHWTPEGHDVAARSLSEFLRSDYAHLLDKLTGERRPKTRAVDVGVRVVTKDPTLSAPARAELDGAIGAIELWGFQEGNWWEIGSGNWTQEGSALHAVRGKDPNWTWISSSHPYPEEFELTFDVYGEAKLVGIGFGPFKDFVVPKPAQPDPLSVRFVLKSGVGQMYAGGAPVESPAAVQREIRGKGSLKNGRLQLKVSGQKGSVRFDKLFLRTKAE